MSEGMPTDSPYASARCCGPDVAPQDVLLRTRVTKSISENPISWPRLRSLISSQFQQRDREGRIDRKRFPRRFCLRISRSAIDNTSSNQNGSIVAVEITPLQPDNLARPKPQAGCNQYHGPVRLT